METTKLSSKGQIVLPKSIRQAHHWETGIEFVIEDIPEGILLRPLKNYQTTDWSELVGSGHYKGLPKTDKQIRPGN